MLKKILFLFSIILIPIISSGQEYNAGDVLKLGLYVVNPIDVVGFSLKVQASDNLKFIEVGSVPKVDHGAIFNGHANKQLLASYDGGTNKIKIGYTILEQNGVTFYGDTVLVCSYYVRCANSGQANLHVYESKVFDSTGNPVTSTAPGDVSFTVKKTTGIIMKVEEVQPR